VPVDPRTRPHPVIKQHYDREQDRRLFVTALFDESARYYDRVGAFLALGSPLTLVAVPSLALRNHSSGPHTVSVNYSYLALSFGFEVRDNFLSRCSHGTYGQETDLTLGTRTDPTAHYKRKNKNR